MELLRSAFEKLAAQPEGFLPSSKPDLCRWLASNPETAWSPKQKYAAWRILSVYKDRLRELGVNYDDLPAPENPVAAASGFVPGSVGVSTLGNFIISFPYNATLVDAVHQMLPGAKWDKQEKRWLVPGTLESLAEIRAFAKVYRFAFEEGVAEFEKVLLARREQQAVERMVIKYDLTPPESVLPADLDQVLGGLRGNLFPFQKLATRYLLEKKRSFLSLPMGAGKTVIALATLHVAGAFPALVICPASLKYVWERHVLRWMPDRTVWVLNGSGLLFRDVDVLVVNYDMLLKYQEVLKQIPFRAIIADESHRLKNAEAQRTQIARTLVGAADYRLFLSGTPLTNRPDELISQLEILNRMEDVGGKRHYEQFYCAAQTRTVGGRSRKRRWIKEFTWSKLSSAERARRERMLHEMLSRTCMFRLSLKDIQPDLPPVEPILLPLKLANQEEYDRADTAFLEWLRETQGAGAAARMKKVEGLAKMNYLRQLAGRGKVSAVVSWLNDFLEDTDEKALVFVDNIDVGDAVAKEMKAPFLHGSVALGERMRMVDRFQSNEADRVMVMSTAGQEGLTLTAARNIVFVQYYWTPAAHDQAIGRAYGRVNDAHGVNVYYFYGEDTIDAAMMEVLDQKRQTVDNILDGSVRETLLGQSVEDQLLQNFVTRAMSNQSQEEAK